MLWYSISLIDYPLLLSIYSAILVNLCVWCFNKLRKSIEDCKSDYYENCYEEWSLNMYRSFMIIKWVNRKKFLKYFKIVDANVIDSDNSSAGRAEDCRVMRLSFGRWFNSSLSEFFLFKLWICIRKKNRYFILLK